MSIGQKLVKTVELGTDETTKTAPTSQDDLHFLLEILQKVAEDPNSESIYPFLTKNLERLDNKLIKALEDWSKKTLTSANRKRMSEKLGTISARCRRHASRPQTQSKKLS